MSKDMIAFLALSGVLSAVGFGVWVAFGLFWHEKLWSKFSIVWRISYLIRKYPLMWTIENLGKNNSGDIVYQIKNEDGSIDVRYVPDKFFPKAYFMMPMVPPHSYDPGNLGDQMKRYVDKLGEAKIEVSLEEYLKDMNKKSVAYKQKLEKEILELEAKKRALNLEGTRVIEVS
jgi:hypothetical protein